MLVPLQMLNLLIPPGAPPLPTGQSGRMVIRSKVTTDALTVTFDFISLFPKNRTIVSVLSVTSTLYSGTDTNPGAVLSGAATFSGTKAFQLLVGGGVGNLYLITCEVQDQFGNTYALSCYLAIEPTAS